MNNSRGVIQPALAVCIGDAACLLIALFSTHFSALSSGWMKMASKQCEHFHECVQSTLRTHRAVCRNTTPEKNIQVEGCDEILDPLKHPNDENFSRSIKIIFRLLLPKNKKFLLAIFSCVSVWEWLYVVLFSLCVFTLQFFAFFSLLHHIYVQEYIEPLNLLLILLCSHSLLLFFARSNDKLFNAFIWSTFWDDDDDDIELAKVMPSEFEGKKIYLNFLE